jgi:uncharacterized protein (TIGR03435 family)
MMSLTLRTRWLIVGLAAVAPGVGALAAQTPGAPAFEVASIKQNVSGAEATASYVQPGGRYTATNVTLRMLMKTAYQVHDTQIVDGPGWIDVDRFDVSAKAAEAPTAQAFIERARLMLRPLLADRFKLVVREERRELPIYGLVLTRREGEFGPQFARTDARGCDGPEKAMPPAAGAPEPGQPLPCNMSFQRPSHAGGRGAEISTLITPLRNGADRVVVDRTGLTGRFDWDLQWTRDPLAADGAVASLFTAVREQLGFRLEAQRGLVDVLVVARVEKPTSN